MAVLVYKSLHVLSPQYLVEDCELVAAADRRQLPSTDIATFVFPRTYTRLGDRAFPVAGPRLWNSLPSNLRQSDLTLQQFRRALKTYLFRWPRPSDFLFVVCNTNVLTHLLTNYVFWCQPTDVAYSRGKLKIAGIRRRSINNELVLGFGLG